MTQFEALYYACGTLTCLWLGYLLATKPTL